MTRFQSFLWLTNSPLYIYIYVCKLIQVIVHQNLIQHCEAIILQLNKKDKGKRALGRKVNSFVKDWPWVSEEKESRLWKRVMISKILRSAWRDWNQDKKALKKKQQGFWEFKEEIILRCKILEKVLNDYIKMMVLFSENHHRIKVRVAKMKEMKEKWGTGAGNIIYVCIENDVEERGVKKRL